MLGVSGVTAPWQPSVAIGISDSVTLSMSSLLALGTTYVVCKCTVYIAQRKQQQQQQQQLPLGRGCLYKSSDRFGPIELQSCISCDSSLDWPISGLLLKLGMLLLFTTWGVKLFIFCGKSSFGLQGVKLGFPWEYGISGLCRCVGKGNGCIGGGTKLFCG